MQGTLYIDTLSKAKPALPGRSGHKVSNLQAALKGCPTTCLPVTAEPSGLCLYILYILRTLPSRNLSPLSSSRPRGRGA